jgi:hypothetical protein
MRVIGIWCEHNFQLYSALPIIYKYIEYNSIYVFTNRENLQVFSQLINHPNVEVKCIQKFIYRPAVLFKKIFETVFVSETFSFVYKHEFVNKESLKKQILRKLFFLKLPNDKVNKIFLKLNSWFFKSKSIDKYFNLDLMITFTKVYYAHLIPSKDKVPHINIMESWDHPMKFPYYLYPNYTLTWNLDLANDTKKIQHLQKVKKIIPLKFKYLYDFKDANKEKLLIDLKNTIFYNEIKLLENKKIILYPTTTSSSGLMHEGEIKFLNELCSILDGSEYFLYIKPKPNAPRGDYDMFKCYKNVIIGVYSSSKNASDMLNPNYHKFRYLLLGKTEIVINVGTTFGLEAAIAEKKILQLELQGDYLGFADFTKTYHLKKYVLSLDNVFKFNGNKQELLNELKNCDYIFSRQLKKWITKF